MRPAWRVPRWSAARRAVRARTAAAPAHRRAATLADVARPMDGCALRRSASLLFRGGFDSYGVVLEQNSDAKERRENGIARHCERSEAIQLHLPLPAGSRRQGARNKVRSGPESKEPNEEISISTTD